jgi:hypothetical protein
MLFTLLACTLAVVNGRVLAPEEMTDPLASYNGANCFLTKHLSDEHCQQMRQEMRDRKLPTNPLNNEQGYLVCIRE